MGSFMQILRDWWVRRSPHFQTEVRIEVNYLREVHGLEACERAMARAQDPHLRRFRRLVAQEAAKTLAAPTPPDGPTA
jgi:hypothetical protein